MKPTGTRSILPSVLGNSAMLGLLALAALLLARLHAAPWWTAAPQPTRWIWAATVIVLYLAASAVFLWRGGRAAAGSTAGAGAEVLVAWASQTGFATALAERSAAALRDGGSRVRLLPLDQVDGACLAGVRRALFIASTTGEGDPPDHALRFLDRAGAMPPMPHLEYALLALGDRQYADFCAFGRQLDQWLAGHGARPLFDRIEVDNADQAALRHWQYALERLGASSGQSDWAPPAYEAWRLQGRTLLNPGSEGSPVYDLVLLPGAGPLPEWMPGDIAEIGPGNAPDQVSDFLQELGLDGHSVITTGGGQQPLASLLERAQLPPVASVQGLAPQTWAASLAPLPHREYSIASIPAEGQLRLLVREMTDAQGNPGLGSGWLCRHAIVGGSIDLRIRANPGFHPPRGEAPLILVGNGTGMAGLRAHLAHRIHNGQYRNWLLFGERNRDRDLFHGPELEQWLAKGQLQRLDLAFSRDGQARAYVQDLLRIHAGELRDWVQAGASILVCGNANGMAPGVDAALAEVLGSEGRDALRREGRYRRDVY